jgi:glucose-fructose oxidoreductase
MAAKKNGSAKAGKRGGRGSRERRVRYAVVGLGYISQAAVLPAFVHAAENSEVTALVSGDAVKRRRLSKKYGVPHTYSYEDYDECLGSGEVDAVFIALPNHLHREYTVRAARASVHVLCEKPMAVTERDCEAMIEACDRNGVKLMIAYRLHFERANLEAVEIVRSGGIGEPRIFASVFSQQVEEGNVRLKREMGGGTLYDIGIYCINAARYLFRDEPTEVFAWSGSNGERRFREVDEMTSAILRFPGERLASFTCSFGAAGVSAYQVVGTRGDLRVDPAYEFADDLEHHLTVGGRTRERTFPKRDQFAPELIHFSDCVLRGEDPEPSGREGLADVRVIRALLRSVRTGRPVRLAGFEPGRRPDLSQEMRRPAVGKPELVRAEAPSGGS